MRDHAAITPSFSRTGAEMTKVTDPFANAGNGPTGGISAGGV